MTSKTLVRAAIVLGVVILVALAAWRGSKISKSGGMAGPSKDSGATASSSPVTIAYDAADADWAVYSSASLNLKVSYPKDWKHGSCGATCIAFGRNAKDGQFVTGISVTANTLVDIASKAAPYIIARQEAKVGDITWTKLTLKQPTTGDLFTSHFTEHKGKLYEFGIGSTDAANISVYGKMLSSFSFLK